nr:MAG TPA: tail assembly chaperone protein [Caudoviricetes sp.]
MNIEERSAKVKIGKKEYELVLTTRATKEIAKRYGGLANLGEKLSKSENFEEALSEIIWLVTTLANQSILIYNYENPNSKKPLLTEELVEIYTAPSDLAIYKDAITEALLKGTKREIESTTSKNV